MQPKWLNDAEPDEHGVITAVIENTQGQRISTFKGSTVKEVADKILESQANANREIARLRRPDQSKGPKPLTLQPKELTPADKLRLATEITDPEKVASAVTEIVTASQGAPPHAVAQAASSTVGTMSDEYYRQEAQAFRDANPDYYPTPENQRKIFAALEANKIDLTRNNLTLVFQALQDQGELELEPLPNPEDGTESELPAMPNGQVREAQPPPETNSPSPTVVTRPRSVSVSTGLRPSDASGMKPKPPAPKKITRAELEAMSRVEYENRLRTEPGFRQQVDALA